MMYLIQVHTAIAGKTLIAVAGSQKIIEWLQLDLNDAEIEIKRYVRTASQAEIKLTFEGFVTMCVGQRSFDGMGKILLLYRSYCIYTAIRFGED